MITTAQALACDLTRSDIRGKHRRKEWIPVSRGIWRLAAYPFTERALVRAAAWAHGGVLDRTTAAWWHGLIDQLPEPLTISVARSVPAQRWTGCAVDVLRRTFPAEDLTVVDGMRVTGRELSILGAVGLVNDPSHFLDRLLQEGEITRDGLQKALERNPRMRGMSPARKMVAVLDADTQSKAEELFRRMLKNEEIGEWIQQYPFRGWAIDFAWPDRKVAVEIDGWAFHRDHKAFLRDSRKRNALACAGWITLSFTWHDLTHDPAGCIELLVAVLNDRGVAAGQSV